MLADLEEYGVDHLAWSGVEPSQRCFAAGSFALIAGQQFEEEEVKSWLSVP